MKLCLSLVLALALASSAFAVPTSAPPVDELVLASGKEVPAFVLTATAEEPAASKPSVLTQLGGGLQDLLFAALAAGIAFLANFLRTKAAESKAARIGLVITESARAAVLELDAAMKPKLKAYMADGVLSEEEKADLKKTAIELLKTKLPGNLLSAATGIFGAFTDTYLSGKIEQAVAEKNALQAAGVTRPQSP